MIKRTEERFGIKPAYLAADPAYGSPRHREHERKRSAQSMRTP
jgi:hypothetical protein